MVAYKKDIISLIKLIGIDLDEVVVDIKIDDTLTFNSIEWRRRNNKVILHCVNGKLDVEFDYEEFDEEIQKFLYYFLLRNYFN